MSIILSDSQHNQLMRVYQELRLEARLNAESNRKIAYEAIPELAELDMTITDISIKSLRRKDGADPATLSSQIEQIKQKKRDLLIEYGFSPDFLDTHFRCNVCNDTGYIENEQCDCFKKRIVKLLYADSRWQNMFREENFDTFDISLYDDVQLDSSTRLTARSAALDALSKAHQFVGSCLDPSTFGRSNLIISGNTGIGKTFLCNCIAKELIDSGLNVVYLTAPSLFEIFEKASFGKGYNKKDDQSYSPYVFDFSYSSVFTCDLLIIDDLGAEFITSFTVAKIFDLLNRRLLDSLPTLISTNLNLQGLKELYSERFTSRIIGSYSWVYLYGDDIRMKRRLLASNKPA